MRPSYSFIMWLWLQFADLERQEANTGTENSSKSGILFITFCARKLFKKIVEPIISQVDNVIW